MPFWPMDHWFVLLEGCPSRIPFPREALFLNHLPQVSLIFFRLHTWKLWAAILREGLNDYSVWVLCRCHKVSTRATIFSQKLFPKNRGISGGILGGMGGIWEDVFDSCNSKL